jgi:hypothetical protein
MTIDLGQADARLGAAGAAVPKFRDGTVRDAAAFRLRLERFREHVQKTQSALFKRVMAETLRNLNKANPVGNASTWKRPRKGYVGGHSRRNWQVQTSGPRAAELPGVGSAEQAGYSAIARMAVTQRTAWLINPVPYMERLEKGWSKQAQAGWIARILQAVLAKYRRAK